MPLTMAAEVLCTRWALVLLRELVAGSTRFNDLRRGVPRMSPTLLSKRLKDLESVGIIERIRSKSDKNILEYHLTESGKDLRSVLETIGIWRQRWVDASFSVDNLDPSFLMWYTRRNLNTSAAEITLYFLVPLHRPPSFVKTLVVNYKACW